MGFGQQGRDFVRRQQIEDVVRYEPVTGGGGGELPIDYRLHEINGQWKVYDMIIDQISIVSNYRAQFDRVIANSSIKELLQRLKQQIS